MLGLLGMWQAGRSGSPQPLTDLPIRSGDRPGAERPAGGMTVLQLVTVPARR